MIKFAVAALWIAAATLGAVFYAFQAAGDTDEPASDVVQAMGGLDYVRTDVISVPIVANGKVDGYFLARLVFTGGAEKLRSLTVPAGLMLTDAVYSHLYANPQIDFTKIGQLDVDTFRAAVRDGVNAKIGEPIIQEVLIEQVDFLSKEDIRRSSIRGWDTSAEAAPAKPASTGH